jgi:ribosomal protein S18 acetylase RimI-like enzyme
MGQIVQAQPRIATDEERSGMDANATIVRLEESGIDRAADVLARAFFDDPFAAYIVPDLEDREDLLYWYYGTIAQYGLLHGEAYTTADGGGVAVWLPEGDAGADAARLEQSGLLDAPEVLGMAAFHRLVGIMGHLNRVRTQVMQGSYWYLPAIGVDPARQGHGLGSALLRPFLARTDAESRSCYLETFKERNAQFYQRYGFVALAEAIDSESGLRFWGMRRDPNP